MFDIVRIERRRNGCPKVEMFNETGMNFGGDSPEKLEAVRAMLRKAVRKNKKVGTGDLSFIVLINGEQVEGVHNLTDKEYNSNQKRINRATEAWADAMARS